MQPGRQLRTFHEKPVVLDDMVPMSHSLKVLDPSAQTHEVVLLERHGRRLRLQSPLPIAPGTAVQLKLEGELLLGEIAASIPQVGYFEVGMQAQGVLLDSWRPHPDWGTVDTEDSVMGSLVALNARLEFHEEERRADLDRMRRTFRKAI